MSEGADGAVVRLEGVPVRLFLESQDHQQDLIRELQLVEIGSTYDDATRDASQRVARLTAGILQQYQPVRTATREQALAALTRGDELTMMDVPVYPGMTAALRTWLRLLEEADALCARGELLLLSPRPEVQELRRWYVRELVGRIDQSEAASQEGPG